MKTLQKTILTIMALCCLTQIARAEKVWIDVTNLIENPAYEGNTTDGWSITLNATQKCKYHVLALEKGTWNVSQVLKGLPKGKYCITLNGFHRLHGNDKYAEDKSKTTTSYLFAGTKQTALKNVYSESLDVNYNNGCWQYTEGGGWWGWGTTYNYPNNTETAAYAFGKGMYANRVEVDFAGGDLTIGVKNETTNSDNWAAFTNWHLEYYAETTTAGRDQLLINEIQNMNIDQFMDPSFNYGGWMEIYNPTENFITLQGCWLSDDAENPKKARIGHACAIGAHGLQILWFGHHDQYTLSQIKMKLNAEGGTIYLSDENGNLLTQAEYPAGMGRTSYARTTDGGEQWALSSTPTPNASNAGMAFCSERWDEPRITLNSRIFSSALTPKITIPEGATLRYTTDGSTPTLTHGTESKDGRISIPTGGNTVLRFALFGGGKLPSKVVTRTFIYKDKNYTLPIISVNTDEANLYSSDYGIFTEGNGNGRPGRSGDDRSYNWNMDWERPANFEYMNTEGEFVINQETAMERCGGWSRAWKPFSFKVKANKQYELQKWLPYEFFPQKPYLKHKTLQIRNGGNDNNCRIIDPALQEIIFRSGLYVDCQAYQPVLHFINGKFMGTINLREPNNKDYVYANYGLDDDEIDQFEMDADSGYVQKCGTKESFMAWYDLAKNCADNEVYDQIRQMVDIDAYINYMACELYLGGDDWPHNNIKGWRPIMEGGKWRFVLFDLDFAFKRSSPFTAFQNEKKYTFHNLKGLKPDGTPWNNYAYTKEIEFVTTFLNMLQNAEFRKQFIDAFCLVAGSVFEPTRSKAIINELVNNVKDMQSLANGYGNGSSPSNSANNLINSINSRASGMISQLKSFSAMKLSGITAQKFKIQANIEQAKLYLNGLPIPTGQFNGSLFPPYSVKAEAPAGYRFIGWKQNGYTSAAEGELVSTQDTYEVPTGKSYKLTACFEKIPNDELVPGGKTLAPVVINEVSAGNSVNINEMGKKEDWIELYNTTDQDIDLEGMFLSDQANNLQKCQITSHGQKAISTLILAHGYRIVWCDKKEGQTQLHADFKLSNADGQVVCLTAQDGTWTDSLTYCAHEGDQTVGRFPDGGRNTYLMVKSSIQAPNIMTTANTVWNAPSEEEPNAIRSISRTAGISIAYANQQLRIKSEENRTLTLRIYTLEGTEVSSHTLDIDDTLHTSVSVHALPQSVYVAYLTDADGNTCQVKFIKK